jgi:integrase
MASLYFRGDRIWMTFKGLDGRWQQKSTGYRKSNAVELRQARRLVSDLSLKERTEATVRGRWDWVQPWIEARWGHSTATTPARYRSHWQWLERWLKESNLPTPANVTREACIGYLTWRKAGRNTCLIELRLFRQIMDEAVRRGFCLANPALKLGLKSAPSRQKRIWTPAELDLADRTLAETDPYGWKRVCFLVGRYQAARLRSCAVPLSDINFEAKTIHYPARIVKGGREYTQPLDERAIPALQAIAEHRRSIGADTLCDVPAFASVELRKWLDGIGIKGVSHHDLRATWVVSACLAGIPEAIAQRFSNHSSTDCHRLYLRYSTGDVAAMLKKLQ